MERQRERRERKGCERWWGLANLPLLCVDDLRPEGSLQPLHSIMDLKGRSQGLSEAV